MKKLKRAVELYLNYYLLRRTPIFVYAMERSGAIALQHSLQAHGALVIAAHYLDPEKLAVQRTSGSAHWACKHIVSKRKPAKVISLVRHPIENMLSTFARSDYGQQPVRQGGVDDQSDSLRPDLLSDEFRQRYLDAGRHLRPLGWFTNEFQVALGINVFQHSFDKQRGFAQFREVPYDVLILRTEMPDQQKAEMVADFVGIPAIKMSSTGAAINDRRRLPPGKPGDLTDYAARYRALKQGVVIPQEYLDEIVDSQHVQHFFTHEEREAMRERYGGTVAQEQ